MYSNSVGHKVQETLVDSVIFGNIYLFVRIQLEGG